MLQQTADSLNFICLTENGELKMINQNGEAKRIAFPDSSAILNFKLDDLNNDG